MSINVVSKKTGDELILEALKFFGALNAIQIAEKISQIEDVPNYIKRDLSKFVIQKRLLMFERSGLVREATGYARTDEGYRTYVHQRDLDGRELY